MLDRAFDEARKLEDEYVAAQHLLLALDVVPRDQLLEKIADVTAGRRVTSTDPEGRHIQAGTPGYMSPEQMLGREGVDDPDDREHAGGDRTGQDRKHDSDTGAAFGAL